MPGPTAEVVRIGKQTFEIVNLPEDITCKVCGATLQAKEDETAWLRLHRASDFDALPKKLQRVSRRRLPSSC